MYLVLLEVCIMVLRSLLQFDGSLLHEAVASSSSVIVRMLLDAKVDVDACSKVIAQLGDCSQSDGQKSVFHMVVELFNVYFLTTTG